MLNIRVRLLVSILMIMSLKTVVEHIQDLNRIVFDFGKKYMAEIFIHDYFQSILSVFEEKVMSINSFNIQHAPRSSSERFTKS